MAFDAEVYLRRLGERLLDDPDQQQPGHRSALRDAAVALVSVRAIGADEAWRVLDDYATATHIRSARPGFVHFGAPLRRHKVDGLPPRQFRVIDQEISVVEVRVLVRDLAITAEGRTLRYRRYLAAAGLGDVPRMVRQPRFPWNATPPNIVDSDGNRPAQHQPRRAQVRLRRAAPTDRRADPAAPRSRWSTAGPAAGHHRRDLDPAPTNRARPA